MEARKVKPRERTFETSACKLTIDTAGHEDLPRVLIKFPYKSVPVNGLGGFVVSDKNVTGTYTTSDPKEIEVLLAHRKVVEVK